MLGEYEKGNASREEVLFGYYNFWTRKQFVQILPVLVKQTSFESTRRMREGH